MRPDSDDEPVQLLWTGGWDSSFRLLQALLVEGRSVQPLYVLSPGRDSVLDELRAMRRIREELLKRLENPARLRPTTVVVGTQYPPSAELVKMRQAILEHKWVGPQYVVLAAVAEALGWNGVELSIERYEDEPQFLQGVVFDESGDLNGSFASQLFRYWSYPVRHLTKVEMGDLAAQYGFLDVLRLRWFCHQPLLGRPCGRCRPCRLANSADVRFAPPALAAARSAVRRLGRALPTRD